MDNAIYATLTRQTGLLHEIQVVANNIANISTAGFRHEGVVFAEHIKALRGPDGSLSMASAEAHVTSTVPGAFRKTGGTFDLAIEGDGYFMVQTAAGNRLTRAGAFAPGADGTLQTPEGNRVLDAGGAPIFVPPDQGPVGIAADGTVSAGGTPFGQIGLYQPVDPIGLVREDGVRFDAPAGTVPATGARVLQGFVETSNVNPVEEIARMIEVQRAYELGQQFLQQEDGRISDTIATLGGG